MKKIIFLFLLISNISFAQVNLTQGLVGYYPFSGNANDASGNNINGVVSNATLTTDRLGNANSAYYFDGATSSIQLPYSNLYNFAPTGSFSISVWIQPDLNTTWPAQAVVVKAPYNSNFILSDWNYGIYNYGYQMMTGYSANNFLIGTTTFSNNQCWYNLITTYTNGIWNIYVNGILEGTDNSQTHYILQDGSSNIDFGKKGESDGDFYQGKMDEVRIYNRVLNQYEVDSLSHDNLGVDAGNNITVCKNTPFTLNGSGTNIVQYAWSPASALNDSTLQNPTGSVSTTTKFYLAATNAAGCMGKDTVLVTATNCPPPPCSAVNSIIINTGYDPIKQAAIPIGQRDSNWIVTAMSPAMQADVLDVCNPVPQPAMTIQDNASPTIPLPPANTQYISCLSNESHVTTGPAAYTMTVQRNFTTYVNDIININMNISVDNLITQLMIDGVPQTFNNNPYGVFTLLNYSYTIPLNAGKHTISITAQDLSVSPDNPNGLTTPNGFDFIVQGTVSSTTGINSLSAPTNTTGCCVSTSSTLDTTICKGKSYLGHSNPGTYIDTIKNVAGCDSVRILHLSVDTVNFDFYYNQNICNPLSVQFYAAGSDSLNPYFSFGDGSVSNGSTEPTYVYSSFNNYIVKYGAQNAAGCRDTLTKTIAVNVLQSNIILMPDTTICYGSTKQLRTNPGLEFCWSPTTYLNDPTLANPTTSATQKTTYYFTSKVQGTNLIINGDFSQGNKGFTSNYNYATPNITEGQYFVGTNAKLWNPGMSSCGDHTGSSGNGNMMLVNGAPIPNIIVWTDTIIVQPNTNYAFSAWAANLSPSEPTSALQFSINENLIGNIFNTEETTCIWDNFTSTWNSGNTTKAIISIVNNSIVAGGNDFALDDISFTPVYIERDSVIINVDSPNVKTNKDTTICSGSAVQLNATGANTYSWTQSTTSLSSTSIYNPIATPATNTQYIVTGTTAAGCIGKDTVNIISNNCGPQFCTGTLGAPIVNITFGSGVTNPGPQLPSAVPGASTTYNYGSYATGTPPIVIQDGDYALVNEVPNNSAWYAGATDHTGNPNGYMAFFNAAPTPGNFYSQTVSGLCPGTTYEFAAWIANVINPAVLPTAISPNITFNILNPTNQAVLGTFNTGDITASNTMTWKQYGSLFTMPVGLNSVTLVLANNNVGGSALPGNDLAIDDITFKPCGPTTTAAISSTSICQTDSINLIGAVSGGLHNPAYQWQISSDTGKTFTDIPGATTLTYKEFGLNPGAYQFQLLSAEVGNIASTTCRFVSNNVQLTVNSCAVIINTYTPVLALDICSNKITIQDASTFNVGDTVVMMQMKGAVIDSSNTASFGTITNYNNAGNYEFNYVKSKTGNVIQLLDSITRNYDIPNGKVQLIRVPYYNNLTVTGTLTCLPWDGSKGGVLIVNAKNTVTMQGNMDVSGKGFSGGNGINTDNINWFCNSTNYSYPSTSFEGAKKGEGITDISLAEINGRGALANGGGGADQTNSGGGGGGNGGNGGLGGNQFEGCSPTVVNGGTGGLKLDYTGNNRVFMGGGGGTGDANNPPPNSFSAFGGNGGGIIIVNANTLNATNGFIIKSNGDTALECNTGNCWEGMGGGGAGGSILLNVNNFNNSAAMQIQTIGGKGGDCSHTVAQAPWRHGPGGGGAGGVVSFLSATVPAGININSNGGLNGVNINFSNDPWGAQPGQNGANLFNLKVAVDSIPFKKNIDSVRINTNDSSCSGFYFNGLAYTNTSAIKTWQWSFDDGGTSVTQNTSHNFTTQGNHIAKLIATDANGCSDSATATVIVNNVLNFDFTFNQNICNPLSIEFDGAGLDSLNSIFQFGDGISVTNNVHPTHVYSSYGNYTVKYSVKNTLGCVDTVTKIISIAPVNANIILTPDTTICYGNTKQLLTNPGLEFCWSPITYLNDPTLANPTTATPKDLTYYFTTKTQGANVVKNGDFELGNTDFFTTYSYCNANNCLFPLAYNGYAVGTNASFFHTAFVGTGRGGTGNFMIVNGGYDTLMVWQQTVPVQKNTSYNFSAWVSSMYTQNFAPLQVSVNNIAISNITAPSTRNTWIPFSGNWVSSDTATVATISIVCTNTSQAVFLLGCDFGLDDISFNPVYLQQDSVIISVDTPSIKTINDTAVCNGTPVPLVTTGGNSYSWNPTTNLSNINSLGATATPVTTTKYIVTGTDIYGCSSKDSVTITINAKPVITKSNDTSICRNTFAQLSVSGGVSYQWQATPTLNNLTTATPIATPTNTEIYHVSVTGSNTCVNTDSIKVSIRPLPFFTVSPDQGVCTTNPVQLSASGGDKYLWSPASAVSNASIANPLTNDITSTTDYSVVITESTCNNDTTLTTTVTLLPPLDISISKSNDLDCSNGSAKLMASGASWYQWSPATGLSDTSISDPVTSALSTIKYTVKGSNAQGCIGYDTIIVYVNYADNKSGYYMPNAFTPNGDGINDCYGIRYWGLIEKLDFSIYDRWGNRVFYTNDVSSCWDGTYKGLPSDPGAYVFIIKANTACGQVQREGNVILIR